MLIFRLVYFQTYIGPVLISVNPYKTLDIYSDSVIETYRNVNFYELPPHMWVLTSFYYYPRKGSFWGDYVFVTVCVSVSLCTGWSPKWINGCSWTFFLAKLISLDWVWILGKCHKYQTDQWLTVWPQMQLLHQIILAPLLSKIEHWNVTQLWIHS